MGLLRILLEQPAGGRGGSRHLEGAVNPPTADVMTRSATAPAGVEAATAALVIRRGPDVGRRWLLCPRGVTVVGRHPGCDVVLAHLSVSRRHAEIRDTGGGYLLSDTGSLVGSYLNGSPIDAVPLRDGDEIKLGVYRLTFLTID